MKRFHRYNAISSLCAIAMIVCSYLFQSSIGSLGSIFPFSLMPPGYVFSINWGVIYVGVIIMAASWRSLRVGWNDTWKKLSRIFWYTAVLHCGWLLVTAYERYLLSVIILLILWIVLLNGIVFMSVEKDKLHLPKSTLIPWSLFLGWITVALSLLGVSQIFYLYQGASTTNSTSFIITLLLITTYVVCNLAIKTSRWVVIPFLIACGGLLMKFGVSLESTISLILLGAIVCVLLVSAIRSTWNLKTITNKF